MGINQDNTKTKCLFDLLWFVSLAECFDALDAEDKYGYGMYLRRIDKGLKVNPETVERHKISYNFYLDLYIYKVLRREGIHDPIYVVRPRWEQEMMRDWWHCWFSYKWQGAKTEQPIRYFD